ncbi:MAG: hypothetical protein NTW25_06475 [Candidatus Kapabacteria bacterium]|nr:hypothetical protein [Candidatus Kapabacteria bacterium]
MKNKALNTILSFLFVIACFAETKPDVQQSKHKSKHNAKIKSSIASECKKQWVYKDLLEEKEAKVLMFAPVLHYDMVFWSSFLIAITNENDTLGFVDANFKGQIKAGSKVKLTPFNWDERYKTIIYPNTAANIELQKNCIREDLMCTVKEVYYCKMEIIKPVRRKKNN